MNVAGKYRLEGLCRRTPQLPPAMSRLRRTRTVGDTDRDAWRACQEAPDASWSPIAFGSRAANPFRHRCRDRLLDVEPVARARCQLARNDRWPVHAHRA